MLKIKYLFFLTSQYFTSFAEMRKYCLKKSKNQFLDFLVLKTLLNLLKVFKKRLFILQVG